MTKNNGQLIRPVLRWILFLPSALLVYIIVKNIVIYIFMRTQQDMVADIMSTGMLSYHPIRGTIYIFTREVFPDCAALLTGLVIVPKYRKNIFKILFVTWILYLLYVYIVYMSVLFGQVDFAMQLLPKYIVESLGELTAFVLAGRYVWKELS